MNSAGQSKNFNTENRRKIQFSNACDEKENMWRSTYKESVVPKKTRHSTGAVKKSKQYATEYTCTCQCSVRNSRQPLMDIPKSQKLQTKIKMNYQPLKAIDESVPEYIISKSTTASLRKPVKEKYLTLQTNNIPTKSIRKYPIYESTVEDSTEDDSKFWSSFLSSNCTIANKPHVVVPKFMSNREQNCKFDAICNQNYTVVHDSIPSLRKKTLKRHLSQPSGFLGVVNLDPSANKVVPEVLYSLEYVNSIIYNVISKQDANILKPQFLDRNSKFLDNRASVINWLIKLHQYILSEPGAFFMGVRIFDKILTLLDIPESNYQLTAMAAYWIAVKYHNSGTFMTGPKLIKLCDNAFSMKCLLEMERNILLILQFDVIVDDPLIFVYYYIYLLQFPDTNMIGFCANYLLEILTLDFNCNTYALSLQAASAVFLSMKFLNIPDRFWNNIKNYYGYHDRGEMFAVQKIMIKNIILTNHEVCPYKESLYKYSTEKYGKVSMVILKTLQKWYDANDISLLLV